MLNDPDPAVRSSCSARTDVRTPHNGISPVQTAGVHQILQRGPRYQSNLSCQGRLSN
jgi:hypothetical protein